jgi:hypothetical protein
VSFACGPDLVMPAHSRPKDGVLSYAYVAGIYVLMTWMAGTSPAMTLRIG